MIRWPIYFWVLLLWQCQQGENNGLDADPEPELPVLRYLALGDSYTIGTGLEPERAYPWLLRDSLQIALGTDGVELRVIAQNGWTTADLRQGIRLAAPDSNFDRVSLLIGVNNQYQNRSLNEYRLQYEALLRLAIDLAQGQKKQVLAISIPDWGVSPAGAGRRVQIGAEIDAFNAINRRIADSLGVAYADITPLSRTAQGQAALIAADSLHFSAQMHKQWAALLFPFL